MSHFKSLLRTNRSGFTVLEALIVLVVVGLLAAFILPRIGETKEAAYVDAMRNDLRNLAVAQELYHSAENDYAASPSELEDETFSEDVSVATSAADADQDSWRAVLAHAKTDDVCELSFRTGGQADNRVLCTGDGAADFSISNTNPKPGEDVTFTADGGGVTTASLAGAIGSLSDGSSSDATITWDFGDGTTDSGLFEDKKTVAHAFANPNRVYPVKMTIHTVDGNTKTALKAVRTGDVVNFLSVLQDAESDGRSVGNFGAPVLVHAFIDMGGTATRDWVLNGLPSFQDTYIADGDVRYIAFVVPTAPTGSANYIGNASLLCENKHNGFYSPMRDGLAERQSEWLTATDPVDPIIDIAKSEAFWGDAGEILPDCVSSDSDVANHLSRNQSLADEVGATSFPTFFVNGRKLGDGESLSDAVAAELQ